MKQKVREILQHYKIRTFGNSMFPLLQDEDIVYFRKISFSAISTNDIICFRQKNRLITHRVVYKKGKYVITKGDNNPISDGKVLQSRILGRVSKVKRGNQSFNIEDLYLFQSSIYFEEIRRVVGLFKKKGIDHLILKGLPLHLFLEKKHPRRIYADCDILVAKKDIFRANKLLLNEGYQKVDISLSVKHKKLKDKEVEESYAKLISRYPIVFDVHEEAAFMMTQLGKLEYLYSQKLLEKFTKSLLNNKRIVGIKGVNFPLLSLEDQIVYLFLHLFHHNFRGGYRYDILVKILNCRFDESKLINTINIYKLNNFVYAGLVLLQVYYPNEKYEKLLDLLSVSKQVKKYVKEKIIPTKIFDDEERIGGGVRRFKLIFYLSPESFLKRILTVFNKQVLYSIYWVLFDKIRKSVLHIIPFLPSLLKSKS